MTAFTHGKAAKRPRREATRDLTEGQPLTLILQFAGPLLFGFLFQQLYSFVDTAIVGRYLGAAKLAAVGDTGSVNFLILGLCTGITGGFAVPIAQAFGAKDEQQLRRCVANAAYLTAALSVVMAVATSLLCPAMLRLMATPEAVLPDAVSYIRIIFMAIPCTLLYNMAGGILRSLGDSRTPVLFLVVASVTNIVLDLVFIIVFHMDVAGAAVATAISQLISGIGCLVVMVRRFPILKLSADDKKFRPRLAGKLMAIGLPMGLQCSITAIGAVLVQWSVNGLGIAAMAATAAAGKISMFFSCVFDALANTMATYAGQNMGARKLSRIGEGLKDALLLGLGYSVVAFGIIWLFGRQLLGLFVDAAEADVLDKAQFFLRVNAAFYALLMLVLIVRMGLQGMGFTRVAMFAGMFEMAARSAVALYLVPPLGFTGAALANPAAWLMADLFLIPCYFRVMKGLRQRMG